MLTLAKVLPEPLMFSRKKRKEEENPGNATVEEIFQRYCAFTGNLHQMAQRNKFKSTLAWTVLWSRGMGLGRNKRKTSGIGCSELVGIGSNSHIKKLMKADIINRLFTSERRRKSSETFLIGGDFEIDFQVVSILLNVYTSIHILSKRV